MKIITEKYTYRNLKNKVSKKNKKVKKHYEK